MSDLTEPSYRPPSSLDRGRYTVEKVLGTGGTATVLLARDTRMNVNRAIKVLHPQFANTDSARTRFMNEAQAQAQLKHPNVLMVHDVLDDQQGVYMVMELAEGGALGSKILAEGCFTARETADIGIHVGEALIVAHAAGLVHRDIKPANILADRHGVLKLADFGIARVRNTDHTLTRSGSIMGTWAFMPPEQREDASSVDQRSDIYAFGVTLYALLTGRGTSRLHNQESWQEAYAGVPDGLATVIQRATRLFPDDRYASVGEMVAALRTWRFSPKGSGPGWGEATELMHAPRSPSSAPPSRSAGVPGNTRPDGPAASADEPFVPEVAHPELAIDPATAPTTATASMPWMTLAGIAGGGMVVAAMLGVIIVLLVDRGRSEPVPARPAEPIPAAVRTPTPTPPDPAPEAPPPEPPAEAPPETARERPEKTTPATKKAPAPKRRVIKVISPQSGTASPPSATAEASTPDENGKLLVRTIPSGASVTVAGRTPSREGGAYVLPIGTHTVLLKSASGEQHSVPVTIRTSRSVEICYSFDTNSACGAHP